MTLRDDRIGKIPYKQYDAEGRELQPQEIDLTVFNDHAALQKAFETVIINLTLFDKAHTDYVRAMNAHPSNLAENKSKIYTTLKAFFSSHYQTELSVAFNHRTNTLFQAIKLFSDQVMKLYPNKFFSLSTDKAGHKKAVEWLQKLGGYIESKIIETPWYVPIEKNHYLLTALSNSTETFLKAQQDPLIEQYISKLNEAKNIFLGAAIQADGSNLLAETQNYINHVNKLQLDVDAESRKCIEKIRQLEVKRNNRFGITNFLVDLFWDQKKKLQNLKHRHKVFVSIENSFQQLTKNLQPLETQQVFTQFSDKLLQQPDRMVQDEIILLRAAVIDLLQKDQEKARDFYKNLQETLLKNVDVLAVSEQASVHLAQQFLFLTEGSVKEFAALNAIRVAVIESLKKTLPAFAEPRVALQWISGLEKAKPVSLDKQDAIISLSNALKKAYSAWDALQQQGQRLLAGELTENKVTELQEAMREASRSTLPQVQQAANDFSQKLQAQVLKNIDTLVTLKEAPIALAQQFMFLTEDAIKDIASLNEVRIAIIESLKKTFTAFSEPSVALQWINEFEKAKPAYLDKEGTFIAFSNQWKNDYIAWGVLKNQRQRLPTEVLAKNNFAELQEAAKRASQSTLPQLKQAANEFYQTLQVQLLKNIDALRTADTLTDHLIHNLLQQFELCLPTMVAHEGTTFIDTHTVKAYILACLDDANPVASLNFIDRWEQLNVEVIKQFDSTLYQAIQDKKNQYHSLQVLQHWSELLDDKKASVLSEESVKQFVTAILWLDQPVVDAEPNPLIAMLKKLTPSALEPLQLATKEKIAELKLSLVKSLTDLSNGILSEEQRKALRARLQFICQANAMYTDKLGELRSHIIQLIATDIYKERELKVSKRYLDELYWTLPIELRNEPKIAEAVQAVKLNIVQDHFTKEQSALHKKYQHEFEFLRTGDLNLWEKIEVTLTGNDPKALTEENIERWRTRFLDEYILTLNTEADTAVAIAMCDGQDALEERKILRAYLQESIATNIASLAEAATIDLVQLADRRRQRALAKLDKIFGLEPAKPVDINLFMLRYFALAGYQQHYADHLTLGDAGRLFIHQFQDMAQQEGGFTTQIIAKLSLDALEAMYSTCRDDPLIQYKQSADKGQINHNVIGAVMSEQDTHIQLPKYLLLNMVLELIVVDIDALLRGEKIDTKLLNDRIAFAMPKLKKQVEKEHAINENNQPLRETLLNMVQTVTVETSHTRYDQLVVGQMPANFVARNHFGLVSNFLACEEKLLNQLKFTLSDQMHVIAGLNQADLDYRPDEESVKSLDVVLNEHKEKLAKMPRASYHSSRKLPTLEQAAQELTLQASIASLETQKHALICAIETKKAQAKWTRNCQDQFDQLTRLIDNEKISLKEFVAKLDPTLYELLPPQLVSVCAAIKQTIIITESLKDESFKQTLQTFKNQLQDSSKNILDIVRDLPDSLIRELDSTTADTVKQLQYRCADRFRHLLVKMLDENHLLTIKHASLSKAEFATIIKPASHNRFWGGWFTGSNKAKTSQDTKLLPEERLKAELKNVNSDSFKSMLELLIGAADAKKIGLEYLYAMKGLSAPKCIEKRQTIGNADLTVGNPTQRFH